MHNPGPRKGPGSKIGDRQKMSEYGERGGGRGFDRPREMHTITCSDCGKEDQVPFKPTDGRPVYCRDCFAKHRPPRRGGRY